MIASEFTKQGEIIDVSQPAQLKPKTGHILTQEEILSEGLTPLNEKKPPQSGQRLNSETEKSIPNFNIEYLGPVTTQQQPVLPLPKNGAATRYFTEEAIAPLKIVTKESGQHYFVKIVDWYSGELVSTIFIRSGQSVNVDLPLGSYKIKYATGKQWYGKTYLFGPETTFSEADKKLDFEVHGSQVSGYTIELFLQRHGNLKTKKISAAQF